MLNSPMMITNALKGQFSTPKGILTRQQLSEMLAGKYKTDIKTASRLISICERDDEIEEDAPNNYFALIEEACAIIAFDRGEIDAKELKMTIVKQEFAAGTEESILEAALNTRLDNGYSKLAERYDFGEFMTQFKPKDGIVPTPEDYAAAIGMGVDMSSKGMWLAGDGIRYLYATGHENVLTQIAANLKMSYSHVSNWHRASARIPAHLRNEISPTVAVEIATAKFSDDEQENNKKILQLVDQARKEKWSCQEARSHVRAEKGGATEKPVKLSWVQEFGGQEELLVVACQWSIGGGAGELDMYHFVGKLVKIFHRLSETAQSAIRLVINDRIKEHHSKEKSGKAGLFDEDTLQELLKISINNIK
jgi:transcriptional regulator with XRE-family HTH domain